MPDEAGQDGAGRRPLRTLADKVNWLIEQAHPAGRGPLSNSEVCFLIHKVTGEEISVTTLVEAAQRPAEEPAAAGDPGAGHDVRGEAGVLLR